MINSNMELYVRRAIRALLTERGWKQKDLAEALGILEGEVSRSLTDNMSSKNARTLTFAKATVYAGAMGVTLGEVVRRAEELTPRSEVVRVDIADLPSDGERPNG